MKPKFFIPLFLLLLFSCAPPPDPERKKMYRDSVMAAMKMMLQESQNETAISGPFRCGQLNDTNVILALFHEAQENGFPSFDKLHYFIADGHFSSDTADEKLIRVDAYVGGACGSCCSELILVSCQESLQVIWSGNCGNFSKEDIRDLDDDGIDEIAMSCGSTWSGELSEWFRIVNFKSGEEHILFESNSANYIYGSYGNEDWKKYQYGDTMNRFYHDSLIDPDGDRLFSIMQIRERQLYYGGKSESEIEEKKQVYFDTVVIPLKRKK